MLPLFVKQTNEFIYAMVLPPNYFLLFFFFLHLFKTTRVSNMVQALGYALGRED